MIKVGRASDSLMAPTLSYLFQLVGAGSFLSVAWPTAVQLVILFCFRFLVVFLTSQGSPVATLDLSSPRL